MAKRKGLSKKVRFEVFKRDSFTCQYCGRRAPDVVLRADHVHPVSQGGTNDILNLVTSCEECNQGKSDRKLDDSTVLSKRNNQAAALQARREQIEMIAQWQRGLADIEQSAISEAKKYYSELVPGWFLNDTGISELRPYLQKYGLANVMASIRNSAAKHARLDDEGRCTKESAAVTCRVLLNSLKYKQQNESNPTLSALRYIAGIARNHFPWCPPNHRRFIEEAHTVLGIPIETIRQIVFECRTWTQLEVALEDESSK